MNYLKKEIYYSDFDYFLVKLNNLISHDIHTHFSQNNPLVFKAIKKSLLKTTESALLSEAKRIRPMICFWLFRNYYLNENFTVNLCDLTEHDKHILNNVTQVALAVEILHCASLVIDDIEDGSTERRGKNSLHLEFGIPQALNAGNWMYFLALKQLPENLKNEAVDTLFDCHIGQALDLSNMDNEIPLLQFKECDSLRWDYYHKCATLKTSRLIDFGIEGMNKILNLDKKTSAVLGKIFKNYGIIYQIYDDIRNFIPHVNNGKLYEDLNSGLRSAVVLSFLDVLTDEEKTEARNEFENNNFPTYFLSHTKKTLGLNNCFLKAKKLLEINKFDLNSIHIQNKSKEYLSKIIKNPFDEIESHIFSIINKHYHEPLMKENVAL
ncbi:polyprenyl synthetase family protein [Silvanigrella aquatica]|uniref:Polyprenyl synthetase n=1 Tax=Silvanigrella aquatica TaxID=1915309 RepID=A0A1L4D1J2_9BACT|nr:polyprenyl synthetase family protein [Silvanigrella aquatica]APJ04061.1 hypothetical protein AXG55_09140 [Silvanigrella aquatica]